MTHPTDDELEAMAMRLDCYSHDWRLRHMDVDPLTDAAAMLRALSAALEAEKRHKLAITGDKINAVSELRQVKAELTTLKAELAEAAGLLKVALKAVNWSFSAGIIEEREWGSARKQKKLLDQIRPFETDARAFLARHQKETDT